MDALHEAHIVPPCFPVAHLRCVARQNQQSTMLMGTHHARIPRTRARTFLQTHGAGSENSSRRRLGRRAGTSFVSCSTAPTAKRLDSCSISLGESAQSCVLLVGWLIVCARTHARTHARTVSHSQHVKQEELISLALCVCVCVYAHVCLW